MRQRPNGILVMAHDLVVKNSDGVPLANAFALLEPTAIRLNLDIKETKVLGALHDLLVEYNLYDRVFLTGLEVWNMNAVKPPPVVTCPIISIIFPPGSRFFCGLPAAPAENTGRERRHRAEL